MEDAATILVVDDESVILNLIHAMLGDRGYQVIGAEGGRKAVRLLDQWPELNIDLALVDVVMPDLGGIETTRQLRRLRPGLRMLLMSGYADDRSSWPEEAHSLPMISKPFTATTLIRRIRETLGRETSTSA